MNEQTNPFGNMLMHPIDVTRMLEQFKLPGVAMSAIVAGRRKDIEALVAANKAAVESVQAMARRQAEILTQAMQALQDDAKDALGNFQTAGKQADMVRKTIEKTLADMTELATMARRAQADVMAPVKQRVMERLQHLNGSGQTA